MIDSKDVAASWLQGLAARGVRCSLRNGRLWLTPRNAYKRLTDDEIVVLRHCRNAIKALVSTGVALDVAQVQVTPPIEADAPTPEPCRWCYAAPCIGDQHPAFLALHPDEAQRRADAALTKEMLHPRRGRF